jgi:hypothetical protein
MKESAAGGRGRRVVGDGAMVISNRVSPDVDEEIIDGLLDEGIVGLVDYGIGASLDADLLDKSNGVGRGSLNDLREFSRVGGYLVAHKDDVDRVVVGRARPGSLRFEKIEMGDGSEKVLKCVQLDAYGEVGMGEFDAVRLVAAREGLSRHTFTELGDEDDFEEVVHAVTKLERAGRLEYR